MRALTSGGQGHRDQTDCVLIAAYSLTLLATVDGLPGAFLISYGQAAVRC